MAQERLPYPDLSAQPSQSRQAAPVIAISATFTAEALEPTLAFWLRELKLDYQIRFAPYNQVFQELLDTGGLLNANRNGMNVVLVRVEDWVRFRDQVKVAELEEHVQHFMSAVRSAASAASSPLLVCICPASPGFFGDGERAQFLVRCQKQLETAFADSGSVNLVSTEAISRWYPVVDYYDPHADELGHIPYTPEFFAALGTVIARKLHATRYSRSYKAIALDCDDTLWQGVCGEDGPEGVRLDDNNRTLQSFMLAQRESGVLLCLCSKNNPEDVFDTFRAHPEMPLAVEHFTAWRLNWELKSANLRSLAEELSLAVDSFILVDNSPAECAEVQSSCPEVLAIALPNDPAELPGFLDHIWAFDRWNVTAEDRARAAMYAQNRDRARAESQATNLDEFLASLNLRVHIAPMKSDQLSRVSQLTFRTNQMNFTSVRRSEAEIHNLLGSAAYECLTVGVEDRFGSYGLTGVMLLRQEDSAVIVDTFLLSCRALGRGVEHRMLARLGEIAHERGLARVDIAFAPTPRNRPAEALLKSIGAAFEEHTASSSIFHFPAGFLTQVSYSRIHAPSVSAQESARTSIATARSLVNYASIARNLRSPAQVLQAVRAASLRYPAIEPVDAPRTPLEHQLAQMWAGLLNLPSVGIHQNFFDLGGHSLLAVQLLSMVRQTFDLELSLKIVYSGDFTVAELAKAIELREMQQAGAGRYEELLKEIESLSDDEVRALLAQEQNGSAARKP